MAQAPVPSPEEPRRGRRRRLTRPPQGRLPRVLPDKSDRPLVHERGDGKTPKTQQAEQPGYYGHPIVKAPVWTWEIPLYFFLGGISAGLSILALAGMLSGSSRAFLLTALWISSTCAAVAPVLLIADLKRPKRFLHMLRVFKWRSPMSVGAWILSGYAPAILTATLLYTFGPLLIDDAGWPTTLVRVLLWVSLVPAALLGSLLATYTAVLLGATAVPAWAARRRVLSLHFAAASLGSAAAVLEIFYRVPSLWALGALAALVETGIAIWLERRGKGRRDAAVSEGRSGRLIKVSGLLAGPVALAFRLVGLIAVADIAFLMGALVSRYAWLEVGRASAKDPTAALDEAP